MTSQFEATAADAKQVIAHAGSLVISSTAVWEYAAVARIAVRKTEENCILGEALIIHYREKRIAEKECRES